jgi:hypothetical protein
MRDFIKKYISLLAWVLVVVVIVLALIAWLDKNPFRNGLSAYELFPLFGLIAFSTMWTHYVMAALRKYADLPKERLHPYFEVTSFVVLAAILLHPGILMWRLWQDGFGLPPGSYLTYVGPSLSWAALLGTVSLCAFLLYELRRWLQHATWWKFVQYASDIAMMAIFIHALALGDQLTADQWFRIVWYAYGAIYILALIYIHLPKKAKGRLAP